MDKNDPPLPALRAFEATVRQGSMTAAARELGTTQPAVSQRIHQLEELVGLVLIDRAKRRSRPTPDGQLYYDNIVGALEQITDATQRLQTRAKRMSQRREMTIAAHFGFAHHWLFPRLAQLNAAFSSIDFKILPIDGAHMGQADLTIRFAAFSEALPHEKRLLSETVYPVCSQTFAARYALDERLVMDDVNRVPLLHMDARDPRWLDWSRWTRLAGLAPLADPVHFQYKNYPLLINAAAEGQGLALGWHGLVESYLADGRLVALGPRVRRPGYGYLLGAGNTRSAGLRPVLDWLLGARDGQ